MKPGAAVRLIADPALLGVVTGRTRSRGGNTYWQIRFPDRADYYRDIHLEIISEKSAISNTYLRLLNRQMVC